jgi:uncharacterized protein (TIGR02246 family)
MREGHFLSIPIGGKKMKLLATFVCLLTLAGSAIAVQDKQPVQLLDDAFAMAMRAGDVDAIVALYADDAEIFPPEMMGVKGKDKIREVFAGMHGAVKVDKFEFKDTTYATSGDLSVGWGMAEISVTPKGGAQMTVTIRFTSVAKKFGDKWLYVSDHASAPMPPPMNLTK